MDMERIKLARYRADHFLAGHIGEHIVLDAVGGFSTADLNVLVDACAPLAPLHSDAGYDERQYPLI